MKDPNHTPPEPNLTLHCQICGNEVGAVYSSMTEDKYRERGGIVDQRCTDCDEEHGTFRELAKKYQEETGEDARKAEVFITKNRKRADFETELAKHKEKKQKDIKNNDIIE